MQQEFLREIIARLERLGVTYAITGSIASNFWGIPRLTHDVDVVVVLAPDQVSQVVDAFSDRYYISEAAVKEAISSRGMFNVIDSGSGLKADMWLTGQEPLNQSMLTRRQRVELTPGLWAHLGTPEDVLLNKLAWFKLTPAQQQLSDAAGIAAVRAGRLDLNYLREWAARVTATDLLEAVLQGQGLKQS